MITKEDIIRVQKDWTNTIIAIGQVKDNTSEYIKKTEYLLNELYAYSKEKVLFKPTKAFKNQFRLDKQGALSYFIGNNKNYSEDSGFALKPWKNIIFENAHIITEEKFAMAMGNYFLTDVNGEELKAEYSFVYNKDLKIILHHSSIPYQST